MRKRGNTRKIDELGRIVLPAEVRRALNINCTDDIEIYTGDGTIILKKYADGCVFCGSFEELKKFKDKNICSQCIENLQ